MDIEIRDPEREEWTKNDSGQFSDIDAEELEDISEDILEDLKDMDALDEDGYDGEESGEDGSSNVRYADYKENGLEWLNGFDRVTFSFSQRKFINKIYKLAERFPNKVVIQAKNADGSITGHMPLSFLRISAPPKREITEEQRQALAERLKKVRENGKAKNDDDNVISL